MENLEWLISLTPHVLHAVECYSQQFKCFFWWDFEPKICINIIYYVGTHLNFPSLFLQILQKTLNSGQPGGIPPSQRHLHGQCLLVLSTQGSWSHKWAILKILSRWSFCCLNACKTWLAATSCSSSESTLSLLTSPPLRREQPGFFGRKKKTTATNKQQKSSSRFNLFPLLGRLFPSWRIWVTFPKQTTLGWLFWIWNFPQTHNTT